MNRSFAEMTEDWLKLQSDYMAALGKGSEGYSQGNKAESPFAWWQTAMNCPQASPFGGNQFGSMMDPGQIMSNLAAMFAQTPDPQKWQEQIQAATERSFGAFKSPLAGFDPFQRAANNPFLNGQGLNGANFQNPMAGAEKFAAMFSPDALSPSAASEQMMKLLDMPGIGFGREKQAKQQALVKAFIEMQAALSAYTKLFSEMPRTIAENFTHRLTELGEDGKQIDSLRALYDLYIDTAEEAFAEISLSDQHTEAYGQMINALMAYQQKTLASLEGTFASMNIPTRTEVDSLHKSIKTSRQELSALRAELADLKEDSAAAVAAAASAKAAAATAEKAASKAIAMSEQTAAEAVKAAAKAADAAASSASAAADAAKAAVKSEVAARESAKPTPPASAPAAQKAAAPAAISATEKSVVPPIRVAKPAAPKAAAKKSAAPRASRSTKK